jgi:BirA family transcriptional regulator, biotin operon repressor / biotin---[acetyl-CoA-carboxylase] ligase
VLAETAVRSYNSGISMAKDGDKMSEKETVLHQLPKGGGSDCYTPENTVAGLKTEKIGRTVFCYDIVDSTNEEAKRQALKGAPSGSLFLAEQQTCGKGRLGRSWVSPPGTGMWFSVLLRPEVLPRNIAATTLLAGTAVCGAVREVTGCDVKIKWPNDIVAGTRKISGILTEMNVTKGCAEFAVVGIGVNVNSTAFPEELRDKATSIFLETGRPVRRIALLQEILRRLELLLKENACGLGASFLEQYKADCVSLGRQVGFRHGGVLMTGTAVDISPEGELIVRLPDGSLQTVLSGEVNIQGFYGSSMTP